MTRTKEEPVISVSGLTVAYGDVRAVVGLDLAVARGEVYGFLGPNGAGKTTTIRALLDLLRPDAGTVLVLGEDVRRGGGALRRRIGFLPGDLALFPSMKGRDTLDFFAALHGREPLRRDAVLDRLGFPREALGRRVREYSTGMRQMIGLTCAIQHDPELLVLDEPTTGLDPIVREAFLQLLVDRSAEGRTTFFSSHVLSEVEACAHRVGLVHGGRVHLTGTLDELRARFPRRVTLRYEDGRRETFSHRGSPQELLKRIDRESLVDLEVRPADLGEVFRHVVSGEGES